MCGISGILNFAGDATPMSVIARMNDCQKHRGPDGEGTFQRDGVALGHRRLSIIDIDGGAQPLSNETNDIWLTFNGELYNYRELRKELRRLGHVFATQSDSEVIVHAYEQWGDACVSRLRGMFAFAIADFRRSRLFLARDHFGIKPLYYRLEPTFLAFASELAPLTVMSTPEVDLQSIDYYLRYRYIPAPRTIYQRVLQLPPAHTWSCNFDGRSVASNEYWRLKFETSATARTETHNLTDDEWTDQFQGVLRETVDAHLTSDVPVGAFLSGGIDSTLIVAEMARRSPGRVKAFSVGFSDADYSELAYAQHAAEALDIELHTEVVQPDVVAIFEDLFRHYGQPFADTSAVPTWCVARLARQHVATVLSGDGADEAFGGYARYNAWLQDAPFRDARRVLRHPKQAWRALRDGIRGVSVDPLLKWQTKFVGVLDESARSRLWRSEFQHFTSVPASAFTAAHRVARASAGGLDYPQMLDIRTYLPGDILTKVDIATMCHGLEARTPFTDLRVMQFAAGLPAEQRRRAVTRRKAVMKVLPKRLLARQFSNEFVHRKKQGFAIPESAWLRRGSAVRTCFDDLVVNPRARIRDYFATHEIDRRVRDFDDHGHQPTALWLLMILGLWLEHHASGVTDQPLAA